MADGPEWFAPKRFGFGASYPIAWQGWAVLAAYGAVVGLALHFLRNSALAFAGVIIPATIVLVLVTAKTTRGGWQWRWSWRLESRNERHSSGNKERKNDRSTRTRRSNRR